MTTKLHLWFGNLPEIDRDQTVRIIRRVIGCGAKGARTRHASDPSHRLCLAIADLSDRHRRTPRVDCRGGAGAGYLAYPPDEDSKPAEPSRIHRCNARTRWRNQAGARAGANQFGRCHPGDRARLRVGRLHGLQIDQALPPSWHIRQGAWCLQERIDGPFAGRSGTGTEIRRSASRVRVRDGRNGSIARRDLLPQFMQQSGGRNRLRQCGGLPSP